MRLIQQLSIAAGDMFVLYSGQNNCFVSISQATMSDYISSLIHASSNAQTQYAAPSSDAFSISVMNQIQGQNVHLILTPVSGFNDGEIVLPQVSTVVDKQIFYCNSTNQVTNFVLDGNGATVTGAPNALAASSFFGMQYDVITNTWYRIF